MDKMKELIDNMVVVLPGGNIVRYGDLGIPTERRVCSNTLMPFIKEQEAKKRQQMKKKGKRK